MLTAVLAILRDGWGMGLLLAPLLIAVAIATVIAILAARPGSLRLLACFNRANRRP
ncbi:hypothetical protein [Sphingomonas sp. Y38-1Y]|uniref:hypothetical protein n=1 Tax=Sphingomonas sp. Y38-1Y TaxID=3078265 RepID=UPI0039648517